MNWQFKKGLHDLGNGNWAYLLPEGTWGWSNAGLITDGDQSLLVDTLFDLPLTNEMLAAMKDATGAGAEDIQTLVNTHANGDHTFGNELVVNAEIIASEASVHEMSLDMKPAELYAFIQNADNMGPAGAYIKKWFSGFDFSNITLTFPTRTFEKELALKVGDKDVQLINVGPAHTQGDTLIYVPEDEVIYTGDILFIEGTPAIWAGPVHNWIAACDKIIALNIPTIVPGHGPITDNNGVRNMRDYLAYIEKETRIRFEAGMSAVDAAFDIDLREFGKWSNPERIVANVDTIYKELAEDTTPPDFVKLLGFIHAYEQKMLKNQKSTCAVHNH